MHADLTIGMGVSVGHDAVEMLMRRAGLKGLPGNRAHRLGRHRLVRIGRRLLRQRRDGIDVGDDQEGDPSHPRQLGDHDPAPAPHDPLRLHRDLLQPSTPPGPTRSTAPQRRDCRAWG